MHFMMHCAVILPIAHADCHVAWMCLQHPTDHIEHACRPNPYHNSAHAADVTQALLCILYQDSLHTKFTDLELLALIISSIIHDVGHPGFSNPFLTKTQDEQALMYNDQSANEALSLSIGFKILQAHECNLFINMSREDYFYLRKCAACRPKWFCEAGQ